MFAPALSMCIDVYGHEQTEWQSSCVTICYITYIIQTLPVLPDLRLFFCPLVTSSFFLRNVFFSVLLFTPPLSLFFSPPCEKPHSNPFPSLLLLPFCSLALPPFTSGISQMAYSNWNLPFCQDKKTSVSPKSYTMKLKFDSLLCSFSITVLLFCHF